MDFERIGAHGIKIMLDSDEAALLYHRLSEGGAAGGRLLIGALLAAAEEECSLSFRGDQFNVEILDSQNGAVIYITEIKPYYYLSERRGLSSQRKINKQLFCSFDAPEKLLRFVRSAACTFFNSPSSQLYTNGSDYILKFGCGFGEHAKTLLGEFGVDYCYTLRNPSEEYEMIIESSAAPKLRELLCGRSPLPYQQRKTDSFLKP